MKAAFWLLLAACSSSGAASRSQDGAKLFAELCASCHGPTGKPNATMVARMNVRDLTAPDVRVRLTAPLIEYQIRKGSQNKLMPAFEGALIDEQIEAIAEYVASPQFVAR